MKAVVEKKAKQLELLKQKNDRYEVIQKQEKVFKGFVEAEIVVHDARVFYAASKISALVRGYLDRLLFKREQKYYRAVKLIQRVIKGKIGRMRWQREYWKSISVVKSAQALEEILAR